MALALLFFLVLANARRRKADCQADGGPSLLETSPDSARHSKTVMGLSEFGASFILVTLADVYFGMGTVGRY